MLKETSELLKQFYDLDDEVFELSQEVMEDIKEKYQTTTSTGQQDTDTMISVEKKLKKYMQMYLGLKMHLLDL